MSKKIKNRIGVGIMIIVFIFSVAGKSVYGNHNTLHIGECPPGQVEIPNGTCGPASTDQNNDLFPNLDGQNNPDSGGSPNTVTFTPGDGADDYERGYKLLAPLPGLEKFDTSKTCAFGEYLDIIIKLLIGICAVLAVVIIVVGGIEYMTSELVSSKEHGKNQIAGAIFGLLLALGAWLLLNELNPKLLELCLNRLPEAVPILQEDRELYSQEIEAEGSVPTDGKVGGCPGKIVQVTTAGGTITGCDTIINSVKAMIDRAWAENPPIKISGSGFRTKARQIELRIQNCGCSAGDNNCIYKKNPKQCNPHTAQPGTSRHERGLAFDLKCEGVRIATSDNKCFVWLKNNAGNYKLSNYKPEPWHWSADGR